MLTQNNQVNLFKEHWQKVAVVALVLNHTKNDHENQFINDPFQILIF
ncbi:hypothetical protein [Rice orange leaf phytoplasma]|nr:hypothetical protein [Rice orange leaf phytoplasma]